MDVCYIPFLLSSVAQIPLAAGIVGADPTGLEWLLLVAAPIVFFVIYLACLMVIAAFGPLVMRNNKSGGTTYLLDRPSRVAFKASHRGAVRAGWCGRGALSGLGYTGRVWGRAPLIPVIVLFTWSWKFAFFFLPLQLIRSCYVHATPRQVRRALGRGCSAP